MRCDSPSGPGVRARPAPTATPRSASSAGSAAGEQHPFARAVARVPSPSTVPAAHHQLAGLQHVLRQHPRRGVEDGCVARCRRRSGTSRRAAPRRRRCASPAPPRATARPRRRSSAPGAARRPDQVGQHATTTRAQHRDGGPCRRSDPRAEPRGTRPPRPARRPAPRAPPTSARRAAARRPGTFAAAHSPARQAPRGCRQRGQQDHGADHASAARPPRVPRRRHSVGIPQRDHREQHGRPDEGEHPGPGSRVRRRRSRSRRARRGCRASPGPVRRARRTPPPRPDPTRRRRRAGRAASHGADATTDRPSAPVTRPRGPIVRPGGERPPPSPRRAAPRSASARPRPGTPRARHHAGRPDARPQSQTRAHRPRQRRVPVSRLQCPCSSRSATYGFHTVTVAATTAAGRARRRAARSTIRAAPQPASHSATAGSPSPPGRRRRRRSASRARRPAAPPARRRP